jgi:hypothetical protein
MEDGRYSQDVLLESLLLRVPHELLQLVAKVVNASKKILEKYLHPASLFGRSSIIMVLVESTFGRRSDIVTVSYHCDARPVSLAALAMIILLVVSPSFLLALSAAPRKEIAAAVLSSL